MAKSSGRVIELEEGPEVELVAGDFIFLKIGESVSISPSDSQFETSTLPSQPLVVSERSGLLFVAHSEGFVVVKTKDVIDAAKEIKEKGSGASLRELCVVDVVIGKVKILALSRDSRTLAICVGGDIHFFEVNSLLSKEQKPCYSSSLGESEYVKDMKWTTKMERAYIVLSDTGKLYHGVVGGALRHVLDNVDAVEWSSKESLIAVARENLISILSCDFKDQLSLSVSFDSWIDGADDDYSVKVDSIRWVRPDCIILGCLQVTAEGTEENYLVQAISLSGGRFTDAFCQPAMSSFYDLFIGMVDDILPFGSGPHILLSYIGQCQLGIIANKKNTAKHINLIGWSSGDDNNEVAIIDYDPNKLAPRIPLQDNDDDNLVVGLSVDKVSQDEKVTIQLGVEDPKEVSPYCVLFCLTLEGKLIMFHLASTSESPAIYQGTLSDEEDVNTAMASVGDGHLKAYSESENSKVESEPSGVQSQDVIDKEELDTQVMPAQFNNPLQSSIKWDTESHGVEDGLKLNSHDNTATECSAANPSSNSSGLEFKIDSKKFSDIVVGKVEAMDFGNIFSKNSGGGSLFPSSINNQDLKNDLSISQGPAIQKFESKNTSLPTSRIQPALQKGFNGGLNSSGQGSLFPFSNSNQDHQALKNDFTVNGESIYHGAAIQKIESKNTPMLTTMIQPHQLKGSNGGTNVSQRVVKIEALPSLRNSSLNITNQQIQSETEDHRTGHFVGKMSAESNFAKGSINIRDMTEELDELLQGIEKTGGFKDATFVQTDSVEAINRGLESLAEKSKIWKNIMAKRLVEIQDLLHKTVQVLARKTYMEGIFKQANDSQYWELWDRQRLSSEFEMKRRRILKIHQDLTNQLIQLEVHFNNLELNKFGENAGAKVGHRRVQSRSCGPRQMESLNSLQNTMNSQLAVAEQLSQCLSQQMALLNIESPQLKPQNVKKDLFKTIGLPLDAASFSSPEHTSTKKKHSISSVSVSVKDPSRRSLTATAKSHEPETARRRRESLDRSWVEFEPPKATVKRTLLQERQKISLEEQVHSPRMLEGAISSIQKERRTPSTIYSSRDKVMQETSKAAESTRSASLFKWDDDNAAKSSLAGGKVPPARTILMPSSSMSSVPTLGQNSAKAPGSLTSQRLGVGVSDDIESNNAKAISPAIVHSGMKNLGTSRDASQTWLESHDKESFLRRQTKESMPSMLGRMSEPRSPPVSSGPEISPWGQRTLQTNGEAKITQSGINTFSLPSLSSSSPNTSPFPSISGVATAPSPSSTSTAASYLSSVAPFSKGGLSASKTTPEDSRLIFSSSISSSSESTAVPEATKPAFSAFSGPGFSLSTSTGFKIVAEASKQNFSCPTFSSSSLPQDKQATAQPPVAASHSDNSTEKTQQKEPLPITIAAVAQDRDSVAGEVPSSVPRSQDVVKETPTPVSVSLTSSSTLKPEGSATPDQVPAVEERKSNNFFSVDVSTDAKPSVVLNNQALQLGAPGTTERAVVENIDTIDNAGSQEDEMDEEAPEASLPTELSLGSLSGFGLGSTPNQTSGAPKTNPFGGPFGGTSASPTSSPFKLSSSSGELFRPASFNLVSPQSQQTSQSQPSTNSFFGGFGSSTTPGAFGVPANGSGFGTSPTPGGFGSTANQAAGGSGFGQVANVRQGQQALGSVLGSFGQSRQIGLGQPANNFAPTPASSFGSSGGGFANAATKSGGFAALASSAGGFAAAANSAGGFAGAAATPGGFGAMSGGGGFGAPAGGGGGFGGFAGAGSGAGFGGAGVGGGGGVGQQGSGFSAFGSGAQPPSQLFTQMRK